MGIKNLNKFLKRHCPNVFVESDLGNYAYKKIAIDISLYIFKYKAIFRERWLDAFINLICCLRRNNIHCVFIYDGQAPKEKDNEKKLRRESRDKLDFKINTVREAVNKYHETNEVSQILIDICNKKSNNKMKSLLRKEDLFNIQICEMYLNKIEGQSIHLSSDDFQNTKTLFDILGVPYFTSKVEGETMCANLALNGKVGGVLSDDTDVLAYGTKLFLTSINTTKNSCVEIQIDNILDQINFTYKQFRDLCIMCGTDYNSNIPKIGPESSYKLLTEHLCLENIEKNTKYNTDILNYRRGRELFSNDKSVDVYIPYCKEPDFNKLQTFLFVNNCRISLNKIKEEFQTQEIKFS